MAKPAPRGGPEGWECPARWHHCRSRCEVSLAVRGEDVMTPIQLIDSRLGSATQSPNLGPSDTEALDAYSTVVTSVAELVIPSVASLRVNRRLSGGYQAQGA